MDRISGSTRLVCLLGSPVAHSISPAMHNTAFQALHLDYVYLAFDVRPGRSTSLPGMTSEDTQGGTGNVATALNALKLFGARGCNLTMPLKKAVIPYLDELSEAARLSGSVNTIVIDDGRLIGHTTDGIGYIDSLRREAGYEIKDRIITILGAGGAAESIIVAAALGKAGSIRIFKRKNASFSDTTAFAAGIAAQTGCDIRVYPMEDTDALRTSIAQSSLLCNATNVGMGDDKRSLVPKSFFHKKLFVSDIIYHTSVTTMFKEAREAGCKTANGKYMLLYQGAAAFSLWTGKEMPIEAVKKKCFVKKH